MFFRIITSKYFSSFRGIFYFAKHILGCKVNLFFICAQKKVYIKCFCVRYLLKKLCHSIIYLAAAAQDTKLAERMIAWPFQGCFRQCDLNDPSGVKPSLKA